MAFNRVRRVAPRNHDEAIAQYKELRERKVGAQYEVLLTLLDEEGCCIDEVRYRTFAVSEEVAEARAFDLFREQDGWFHFNTTNLTEEYRRQEQE